jgi:hypothetical protein
MKVLTALGFVFAALAWLWLAIRYLDKGDVLGGVIFLVTAIISMVLFLRQITEKK